MGLPNSEIGFGFIEVSGSGFCSVTGAAEKMHFRGVGANSLHPSVQPKDNKAACPSRTTVGSANDSVVRDVLSNRI